MAWRTKTGQSSPERPHRRGTEPATGYVFRQDPAPGKQLVHEAERKLHWEAMSPQERRDFGQRVLWGDED